MNDLYLEIWSRPGHASFDRVVEDPDAVTFGASVRIGLGEGHMTVPAMWEYLNDALFDDPADPANNVRTIARIYNEVRPEIPIAEWFLDDLKPTDEDPTWEIVGLGIAKMFGYLVVEPPDWDGSTDYVAAIPDWVYGGRNIAGDLTGRYTPERVSLDLLRTDDGTYTITVFTDDGAVIDTTAAIDHDADKFAIDAALTALSNVTFVSVDGVDGSFRLTFNDESTNTIISANSSNLIGQWQVAVDATGGTFTITVNGATTGNIAHNASADDVKTAVEALAGVTDVDVTRTQTATFNWTFQFIAPDSPTTFTVDGSLLTGGAGTAVATQLDPLAQITLIEQGKIVPAGWEISRSYLSTIEHGTVIEFRMWETGDPALPAGCGAGQAMMFNGLEPAFPGIQKVLNVTPGALYQVHAWVTGLNAGDTVRMVIRTLAEQELNGDARDEQTIAVSGAWQEFSIPDLRIPEGVTQVIFRFGHVDSPGVDPGRIFVACPTFRLGFAPETWGGILVDQYVAATTGVPTRTAAGFGLWWDERDVTGVDRYLELDFDATDDSAGVPWIRTEEMTIKRGLNGIQLLDVGAKIGYEHRVIPKQLKTADPADDGVWLLQAFNPDGMDDGHPGDDEFLLTEAVRLGLQFYAPRGSRVIAEGREQQSSRAISAAAEASMGAIEVYLNQRDLEGGGTLAAAAATGLADSIRRTKSVAPVIRPLPDEHQPLIDWLLPGNTEDLEFPPLIPRESHRVREVTIAVDDFATEYQLALGADSAPSNFSTVSKAVAYLLNKPDLIREEGRGPGQLGDVAIAAPATCDECLAEFLGGGPGRVVDAVTTVESPLVGDFEANLPSYAAGDVVVIIVKADGGEPTAIAGWFSTHEPTPSATAVYWKETTGSEGAQLVIPGVSISVVSVAATFRGVDIGTFPPDFSAWKFHSTSVTLDPAQVTMSHGDDLYAVLVLVGGIHGSGSVNVIDPGDYVELGQIQAGPGDSSAFMGMRLVEGVSDDPPPFTHSPTTSGGSLSYITMALRFSIDASVALAAHTHTEDEVDDIDKLAQKAVPVNADRVKIYDSEDDDTFKYSELGDLPGGAVSQQLSFFRTGTLEVTTGASKFPALFDMTLIGVRAAVGTAPTGADLIVDVNKNGTTVYTTQGNRPTISDGNTSSTETVPDVTAVAAGDLLSVDIDQVGSSTEGSDLVVAIEFQEA